MVEWMGSRGGRKGKEEKVMKWVESRGERVHGVMEQEMAEGEDVYG